MVMQKDYIVSQGLNMAMQFMISFVPILLGVYTKEFYDMHKKKKRKIKLSYIFVTSIILSSLTIAFVSYIIESYGLPASFTILFIAGGWSNFIIDAVFNNDALKKKVITMILNGNFLKIFFTFLTKSKGVLKDSIDETLKETEEDNKEKETKDK